MKSKKNNNSKSKPKSNKLVIKLTNYLNKKKNKDLCCEEDYNREEIILEIFTLYNNDLDAIDNDIVKFIGYKIDLVKEKDIEGIKLWDYISNYISTKKSINKQKIEKLMLKLPLYYLLSFLGNAYMFNKNNK